ncbi:jg9855 [Pararge aegeria aegeria]|uniref:Jg9855 protein n=1 Tax=Pararge aegeria aegeria TaxID=348720 RepID=A0A8S4QNN6_9NEOP|nr:jg9855 [Pararge aegeria aegeria]
MLVDRSSKARINHLELPRSPAGALGSYPKGHACNPTNRFTTSIVSSGTRDVMNLGTMTINGPSVSAPGDAGGGGEASKQICGGGLSPRKN